MLRIAVRHEQQIRYFLVPENETDLGSAEGNGICVPLPGISRRHLRVAPRPDGLFLKDLGSKNGLRRRGERFTELLLRPGEGIQVGRSWLSLEEVETPDLEVPLSYRAGAHEPGDGSPPTTDRVESPDAHGTAGDALRVVREIERLDRELAGSGRAEVLASAGRALGAQSLFTAARGTDGPALTCLAGLFPSEDELELAVSAIADGDRSEAATHLPEERLVLVRRIETHRGKAVLAAVLPDAPGEPRTWKRDFLEYLCARLSRPEAAAPSSPLSPETSPPLALPDEFVRGDSAAMRQLLDQLRATVASGLDVVILGETGTGKELVARAVHASGPNRSGPFIAINCAAIPADLLEAELFGVKARVATGVDARTGLFVKAEGGSVFLDEIGDMPETLQAKLLRALQEREVLPVGAHAPEKIRVRVISASNKNLPDLVRRGRFRADLFYRLRGLQFHIPPLRERREDIPALALVFAARAEQAFGKRLAGISRKALGLLGLYEWPGNVRELKSEIDRAVLVCPDGAVLASEHFAPVRWAIDRAASPAHAEPGAEPPSAPAPSPTAVRVQPPKEVEAAPLQARIDELERGAIREALAAARGNRSLAARMLGVTRNGLAIKMRRLGIGNGR